MISYSGAARFATDATLLDLKIARLVAEIDRYQNVRATFVHSTYRFA